MNREDGRTKQVMRKEIGLMSALALVVGTVMGAGAFMKPPAVLAVAGDSSWAIFAWLFAGIISMAGGLTLCELGVMYPRTGGVYVYLEEIYGKKTAYLYGWMMACIFGPATLGALAGYFSSVFCLLFGISSNYNYLISAGVLLFVLFINCGSARQAGYVQSFATLCKLLPVLLLVVFGLFKGSGNVFGMSAGTHTTAPFSVAILAALFAYDGWAQVAAVAGEIKNPDKILPRAIIGGLLFLIITYISINVALFKILPPMQLVSCGHDAASIAAQMLFGIYGGNLVSTGIMIAMIGGLNGYAMSLSRLVYAMSERDMLPKSNFLKKIDEFSGTPVNSSIVLIAVSYIFSQLFDADNLSDIAVFSLWLFYILAFVAVIIARKRHPDLKRSYKVPLYPILPIVAVIGAVYVTSGMLYNNPRNSIFSLIIMAVGVPVYYIIKKCNFRNCINGLRRQTIVLIFAPVLFVALYLMHSNFAVIPQVSVGVVLPRMPFVEENSEGVVKGYDIALLNMIGNEIGTKFVFRAISIDNIFESVRTGHSQMAAGVITVTDERKKMVNFTQSYLAGGLVLVSHAHKDVDYKRVTVGVKRTTTAHEYVQTHGYSNIVLSDSTQELINDFNENRIAVIIDDQQVMEYCIKNKLLDKARIIEKLTDDQYAFVINSSDNELRAKIDKAIEKLRGNGEIRKLNKEYFGE